MNVNVANPSVWKAPVPPFFDEKNAGKWGYRPDIAKVFDEAAAWRKMKSLRPAAQDQKKVHLLLIDEQKDFCFPEGTLYVGGRSGSGAIDDSGRAAKFIYANIGSITKITATLDTHVAYQIFSPSFWEQADGSPAAPHTMITTADIDAGKYRVSPQAAAALGLDYVWLTKYARHYCQELEKAGKYVLYIWPFHCLLGTEGHNLVGVIDEAARFHAYARGADFGLEIKGGNPLTENYSVLSPEVRISHDQKWKTQKNVRFIQTLLDFDRIVIMGQAASHCVKSTIDDLLTEIIAKDPALAKKVYVASDCMSAVAVPDGKGGFFADFTPQAEDALKRFAAAGMHVVSSTDPVDTWPDF
jgi:nicotinamidase-related amidase